MAGARGRSVASAGTDVRVTEPEPLAVDTAVLGGHATVTLAGELDMSNAELLRAALSTLADQGVRTVVVDLAKLEFIDSTGLSELVQALKRSRADGGEVVLRSPQPATLRVLEIVGLTELFQIEGAGPDGH